jgi:hypothetical protein
MMQRMCSHEWPLSSTKGENLCINSSCACLFKKLVLPSTLLLYAQCIQFSLSLLWGRKIKPCTWSGCFLWGGPSIVTPWCLLMWWTLYSLNQRTTIPVDRPGPAVAIDYLQQTTTFLSSIVTTWGLIFNTITPSAKAQTLTKCSFRDIISELAI